MRHRDPETLHSAGLAVDDGYGILLLACVVVWAPALEEADRRIGEALGIGVRTTLLSAHALPPEYVGRPDDYITLVCEKILPAAARDGLADAVDAFCEKIAFTPAQTRRVFEAARAHGLRVAGMKPVASGCTQTAQGWRSATSPLY